MPGRFGTSVRGVSLLSGVALLVALAATPSAQAATVESEEKLTASDGAAGDLFGYAVAVSGDRVVVGAPQDDEFGSDSGSLSVFEPDGTGDWSGTRLTASDGAAVDGFGYAVAVSGDRVVVGAPGDDDLGDESGSVSVFEPDGSGGWSETKLTAWDGAAGDLFGYAVAVSGERVVVGAPFDDEFGSDSGSVSVFEPNGSGDWSVEKLTASDGAAGDLFGLSVAVSGERVVVGAPGDGDLGSASGSVSVFEPNGVGGWSETKLTASDGAVFDQFGYAVAVSGERVVVGAPGDDELGSASGSVSVFEPDGSGGWSEEELTASDGAAADDFGDSVAVSDDRVVVGAARDDDLGSASGSAYVFGLAPVDVDGDGVADADDVCAGTDVAEPAPAGLKKNRYWTTGDGGFVDATGKLSPYTIADTAGCSVSQIIEAAGLGSGHLRFGITASALDAWVAAN